VDICKGEQVSKANQPEGQKGNFMRRAFLQVALKAIKILEDVCKIQAPILLS
jgi:hypothetical protein